MPAPHSVVLFFLTNFLDFAAFKAAHSFSYGIRELPSCRERQRRKSNLKTLACNMVHGLRKIHQAHLQWSSPQQCAGVKLSTQCGAAGLCVTPRRLRRWNRADRSGDIGRWEANDDPAERGSFFTLAIQMRSFGRAFLNMKTYALIGWQFNLHNDLLQLRFGISHRFIIYR